MLASICHTSVACHWLKWMNGYRSCECLFDMLSSVIHTACLCNHSTVIIMETRCRTDIRILKKERKIVNPTVGSNLNYLPNIWTKTKTYMTSLVNPNLLALQKLCNLLLRRRTIYGLVFSWVTLMSSAGLKLLLLLHWDLSLVSSPTIGPMDAFSV